MKGGDPVEKDALKKLGKGTLPFVVLVLVMALVAVAAKVINVDKVTLAIVLTFVLGYRVVDAVKELKMADKL